MAERQAARLLQPWLSQSTTSLYTRQSIFTPSSLRIPASFAASAPSKQTTRPFSVQRALNKKPTTRRSTAKKSPYSRDQALPVSLDNMSMLVPMTFVPPPMSKWPRGFKDFLHMGWLVGTSKFVNYLYFILHKVYSKPGWRSRPLFKMRKSSIKPTALDLHARMNSAIASGSKTELKKVCSQELYEKLSGIIDSRPKGHAMKWEIEGGRAKCSVRDDRIAMIPLTPTENRTIRQAVVAVESTQRIVTIDNKNGGAEVPGTAKAKSMRENIVLTSYVDPKTWQQGPWKVWGTLPDSTLEAFVAEMAAYKQMADEQTK
ncbi:hypothetical protein BJ166DRAFT_500520 [Pestalotiopsis sp. NC0098]|nr:hypothetical protein BJ166DRAFT_500520 [Pestalotiopsis sp. NC0098]